jgi:hypothetical protein
LALIHFLQINQSQPQASDYILHIRPGMWGGRTSSQGGGGRDFGCVWAFIPGLRSLIHEFTKAKDRLVAAVQGSAGATVLANGKESQSDTDGSHNVAIIRSGTAALRSRENDGTDDEPAEVEEDINEG